jgi:2-polyprenyl-3-methyl-5-hydroxy-6-metoxy-1,4-benzoquinol methylase
MDNPDLDRESHFQALRGLARLNRWTGNAKLVWGPIRELARSLGRNHLTVLDIATGAGDVPVDLSRFAKTEGIKLDIDACDVSSRAIEFAAETFRRSDHTIRIFQRDVLANAINGTYDVVACATFLHHLTEEETQNVLEKMLAAAVHRVVIVDLVRSTLNWWQVWFASRALTRSKIVHFDGPQSIRAAFTVPEIRRIAEQAGLQDIRLRRVWPCRFVLVGGHGR